MALKDANIYYLYANGFATVIKAYSKSQISKNGWPNAKYRFDKHSSKDLSCVVEELKNKGYKVHTVKDLTMGIKETLIDLHDQFLEFDGSLDKFAKLLGLTREQTYQLTRIGEQLKGK